MPCSLNYFAELLVDQLYLSTSCGFLPVTGAPRQANHLFSWTMFNSLGSLPLRDAPGISASINTGKSSENQSTSLLSLPVPRLCTVLSEQWTLNQSEMLQKALIKSYTTYYCVPSGLGRPQLSDNTNSFEVSIVLIQTSPQITRPFCFRDVIVGKAHNHTASQMLCNVCHTVA